MSKHSFSRSLVFAVLPVLWIGSVAFGWAGTTHALLCQKNFDLPVVSQFLGGINQSSVENYTSEPNTASHNVQWASILDRKYIDTATPCSNGFDWNALNETTRLQYLQHHLGDDSVPAHHKPAYYEYPDSGALNEGLAEASAAAGYTSLGDLPNIANTTSYTHTETGHSYNFTGTINQVVSTYYNACIDNAHYYRITENFLGLHDPWDVADAVWNGLKIDLMLQRAVMVDYFLAKQNPVLASNQLPTGSAGGNLILSQAGAYDPDCVSWNSNGTYSQIYGVHTQGLQYFLWDVNGDVPTGGAWDYGAYSTDIAIPVNDLIAMGVPANQWTLFYTCTVDNEGKAGYAADWMYLSTGGIPEPATMSLLGVGALALLRRRRK